MHAYLSPQLLKAHSGHLEIESTLGRGTTAVITLPVLQPETVDMLEVGLCVSEGG